MMWWLGKSGTNRQRIFKLALMFLKQTIYFIENIAVTPLCLIQILKIKKVFSLAGLEL